MQIWDYSDTFCYLKVWFSVQANNLCSDWKYNKRKNTSLKKKTVEHASVAHLPGEPDELTPVGLLNNKGLVQPGVYWKVLILMAANDLLSIHFNSFSL